jgi:hypothetical protein
MARVLYFDPAALPVLLGGLLGYGMAAALEDECRATASLQAASIIQGILKGGGVAAPLPIPEKRIKAGLLPARNGTRHRRLRGEG